MDTVSMATNNAMMAGVGVYYISVAYAAYAVDS